MASQTVVVKTRLSIVYAVSKLVLHEVCSEGGSLFEMTEFSSRFQGSMFIDQTVKRGETAYK